MRSNDEIKYEVRIVDILTILITVALAIYLSVETHSMIKVINVLIK